jgi:hypothetical protein
MTPTPADWLAPISCSPDLSGGLCAGEWDIFDAVDDNNETGHLAT